MSITTIIGTMGSGKSAKIIERYKFWSKTEITIAFKPKKDTRSKNRIESRNGEYIEAIEVESFYNILDYLKENNRVDSVFIDELQFLESDGLKEFFIYVSKNKIYVTAGGLDLTSELDIFNTVSKFMCYSDNIIKIFTICKCGGTSLLTDCLVEKNEDILVGGDDIYVRACTNCHSLIKNN